MGEVIGIIGSYLIRIAPGLVLGGAVLYFMKGKPHARIVLYVALFILLRDAMTPLGLWSFGREGFFWIRLHPNPLFLIVFGVSCGFISLLLYVLDRYNRDLVQWTRGNVLPGFAAGSAGAAVVTLPLIIIYHYVSIESRGGAVPPVSILPVLIFALLGNLLEETLFRGYVLGFLSRDMGLFRAGIVSGVIFSFCHIFLSITVTGIGYPLLVFALWEGIIAGLVGARYGVLPATLTHGGAIFILTSGIV